MKTQVFAAIAACALLGGCAEAMTTMMMLSDQMAAEQGYYYDDQHDSEYFGDRACGGLAEYGVVNNQGYLRVRNSSSRSMEATVTWNSGLKSPFSLSAGETSQFIYLSPSLVPSNIDFQCYG
ncbi:MAG: hypothetical protein V7672_06745 [Brevundimonas sp.]|jgi:hypothetical protein|uniref:hypothetical protein n=1 Tax=Brevundimonas sp. TaxID=1871086 RepID=UPI003001C71D